MKKVRSFAVASAMAALLVCLSIVLPFVAPTEAADTSTNLDITDEFLDLLQYIDGLTYQIGSNGLGVMEVQNLLISSGYLPANGADGSYGNQTAGAVMEFQVASGLDATGIADVSTQYMLLMDSAFFFVQQKTVYIARVGNYATIIWPGEAVYVGVLDQIGDFVEGTYYFADGNYYAGEFSKNLRSGKGTAHFSNGDVYVGAWANDAMNGQGTYYYGGLDSTEYYEGNMTNNAMDGEGIYYLNGQIIAGTWSDNQYIG